MKDKDRLVFYHKADLDGLCSAAVVKKFVSNCDFFGIDYGDEFPYSRINNYRELIFVDFSLFPFKRMVELASKKRIILIDHHKTTKEELLSGLGRFFGGVVEVKKSACELCWDYFSKEKEMPLGVRLLGRYDVWDLKAHPLVLSFQYGMRSRVKSYDDDIWELILDDEIEAVRKISEEGEVVLKYQKIQDEKYLEWLSKKIRFEGFSALIINKGLVNSLSFCPEKNKEVDLFISYVKIPSGLWAVSLYSNGNVDVSKLAKKYGGGGHAGAAGFHCVELPFDA